MIRMIFPALLLALGMVSDAVAQPTYPYVIDAAAGHYPSGDGGPATDALLESPHAALVDAAGKLYIADTGNTRVRKVAPDGVISTMARVYALDLDIDDQGNLYVASGGTIEKIAPDGSVTRLAGTGQWSYTGDGGPAVDATHRSAQAIVRGADGSIYFSDPHSNVVRKIAPDGIITTFAGTGDDGFSGDGGPASAATLSGPMGLAFDSAGTLYIADRGNNRIRRVSSAGNISTFAGSGEWAAPVEDVPARMAPLTEPYDIAVDSSDVFFIALPAFERVVSLSLIDDRIRFVAGNGMRGFSGDGGPAVSAQISDPQSVSLDDVGNLYIADRNNERIRMVAPGGLIRTVAGKTHFEGDGGPATQALLFRPSHAAVDAQNNLYISDSLNNRIRKVTPDGTISTYAGTGESGNTGDGGPATAAALDSPGPLAIGAVGDLYVATNRRVRRIGANGVIEAFAGTGGWDDTGDSGQAVDAQFKWITGLAFDPATGMLYIADHSSNRVRRVRPDGVIGAFAGTGVAGFSGDGGMANQAQIGPPHALAIGPDGSLYIGDSDNARIRRVLPDGTMTTVAGNGGFGTPTNGQPAIASPIDHVNGLAVDHAGNLYYDDWGRVFKITSSGLIYRLVGGTGELDASGNGGLATEASLLAPRGLAVDAAGDVYLVDESAHQVRKLTLNSPVLVESANGSQQSGLVGQDLPEPVAVRVMGRGGLPVAGVPVAFTVASGDATVGTSSVMTDAAGIAAATVTAGPTPGDLTVTATAAGLVPVTFAARSVVDPAGIEVLPTVPENGVVGGGLSVPPVRDVAPGGLLTVWGAAFAPDGTARLVGPADLVNGKLPTNLANVCVMIGPEMAYMLHVFPNQLNVQAPALTPGEEVDVRVVRNCGTPEAVHSPPQKVMVKAAAPEFFYWTRNPDGRNPVAAVDPLTNEFLGAPGLIAGQQSRPARPGDLVDIYATAFGAANPAIAPGELPTALAETVIQPQVTIGGQAVPPDDVVYSGVTQWAGVYLLRFRLPALEPGDHPVTVTMGDSTSPDEAYLTVAGTTPD